MKNLKKKTNFGSKFVPLRLDFTVAKVSSWLLCRYLKLPVK